MFFLVAANLMMFSEASTGGGGSFQDLRHGFLVPRKWFGFAQRSWLIVGHATQLVFQRPDP